MVETAEVQKELPVPDQISASALYFAVTAESGQRPDSARTWHASEASEANEHRDQCVAPELPVPQPVSKDRQTMEGQASAKPHLERCQSPVKQRRPAKKIPIASDVLQ